MSPRLRLVLAVAVLTAATAFVLVRRLPAREGPKRTAGEALPAPWTPAERHAIDAAVAAAAAGVPKLSLRPAIDGDATDSDEHRDLDAVYGTYHPYFTRGDLNGDGRQDFVQAFVEKERSGPWFHIAVFFGKPDGTFENAVWVEKSISLADGDLGIERSLVVITPDLAADPVRRWRWEPSEHAFVDPDAEPRPAGSTDDDAPDETPEQKPRARI